MFCLGTCVPINLFINIMQSALEHVNSIILSLYVNSVILYVYANSVYLSVYVNIVFSSVSGPMSGAAAEWRE